MVVSLAAAGGDEAVAFVKCAGGEVGFAEFEKDAVDCGAAELVEGGEEERRGDALPTKIAVDGNIEDFGFVDGLPSGHEADRLAICMAHEEKAAGRFG
jgi:hypothetical protein